MKKLAFVSFLLGMTQISHAEQFCTRVSCENFPVLHTAAINNEVLKELLVKALPFVGYSAQTRVFVTSEFGAAIEQLDGKYTLISCSLHETFGRAINKAIACDTKVVTDLSITNVFKGGEYPVLTVGEFMFKLNSSPNAQAIE